MNIDEKMTEVVATLHKGINGVLLDDVAPEHVEDWSPDYAVIKDVVWDVEDHYFDNDRFIEDLKTEVGRHFPGAIWVTPTMFDEFRSLGTVVMRFHRGSHEIEVYRLR